MSSPSTPPKPKWSPGGAIRRTSTILSMGRSKTPSRASSEHESDSSSLKGVVAIPPSPTPKSASPRSSLDTEPSPDDPAATPSKSRLARMGGALRRPSSLIPRRRTTSMASSLRDAEATNSKAPTPSALRSSTDPAPQPILTAEPEALITAAADPHPTPSQPATEPQPSAPLRTLTPPPVSDSAAAVGLTDEPEELVEPQIIKEVPLPTSNEVAPVTATETEAEQEPAISSFEPTPIASEEIAGVPVADKTSTPLLSEPPAESEEQKQDASPVIEQAVAPPTPEVATIAPEVAESARGADALIAEEQLAISPSPLSPVEVASPVVAIEDASVEPLREVSSLNSSFEDLGASAKQLKEEETPAVQADVPAEEPNLLTTPVDIVSLPTEIKVEESAAVIIAAAEEQPLSSIPEEKDQPAVVETPVVAAVIEEHSVARSLPIEIPAPAIESAAPSPVATQPLLPLEVQEISSVRQRNGSVAPMNRDHHHTKRPEEYRSVLSTLLNALFGLIRRWRSGRW
ncbi:hypothetical protein H0H87_010043 [Tephrocybe sp. NHM501043]|nr:hypothetical protein H0H87_010043 [Tephrocybe sp. NHM501043]